MTRRREREIPECAGAARRMVLALGRRCANADPVDLRELLDLHGVVEDALTVAVAGMRANGFSWSEIAEGLGTTRQAAHMRFGARVAS